MGLVLLTERYADQIGGVIHCFDRLIFQGVLPQIKLCQGDYRRLLCARAADQGFHAVGGAAEPDDSAEGGTGPGLEPGLVAVFSSVERCSTYKPLPDYYFYSIDAELGLCFVRVPTWAPSAWRSTAMGTTGRQVSFGAGGLAIRRPIMRLPGSQARPVPEKPASTLRSEKLHGILDRLVRRYCPVANI